MISRSPLRVVRHLLTASFIFAVATGCAGSKVPIPETIEPPPPPEEAVVEAEVVTGVKTLEEILGPISFDPDTVKAGRFDTGRMWTFEAPPMDWFEEAYGFRPDEAWFEHARMASLRLTGGLCSASFVSANGLVFTNHHCGRDYVTQVSEEGETFLEDGFYARTLEEERRVEDAFVDQLVEITDVTARVHAAMDAVEGDQAKAAARMAEIQSIQEEFDARNGLHNEIIELFNGGRYSVYSFRRYDDIRLVMAPELDIGYFGGDPDNFTYPRYNLDVSFFRVYENGEPLDSSEFYFRWSESGPVKGDPVFVIGNPGSTSRLDTVAQLAFYRDFQNPYLLHMFRTRMKAIRDFLDANPDVPDWEEWDNNYFTLSNADKSFTGRQEGLLDSWLLARKAAWEKEFRDAVMNDPVLKDKYGDPWSEIAQARAQLEPVGFDMFVFRFTNPGDWLSSAYLTRGFLLHQYAFMLANGYDPDSGQMQGLTSLIMEPIDVHPDLERGMLAAQLSDLKRFLGDEHPLIAGLLGMRQPAAAAAELMRQTVLGDTAAVRGILEGAPGSIQNSTDPIVAGMRDLMQSLIRMQMIASPAMNSEDAAMTKLARAVYDVYGTSIPPDATSSLRIQDGVVIDYPYNGTIAPVWTTFYGLYDRWASHGKTDPWALPERWQNPPPEFDLDTPINFVSTCDIIGGNSGSPVLNRDLEVVGIAFDGNIESLPGAYIFLPELNRCVSVHSAGIIEVISDLFGYKALAEEMRTGSIPPTP